MAQNKVVKAGLGYSIGNILIKGIAFLTLPIFSRILTKEQYGIFSTYVAYETILSVVLGLGLYASLKNAKIDFRNSIGDYVKTIISITFIWFICILILVLFFNDYLTKLTHFSMPLLIVLVVHSYSSAVIQIYNSKMTLNYEYKKYLIVAGFNAIMNVFLSLLLIYTLCNSSKENGRILGYAVPAIFIAIIIFIIYFFGKDKKFSIKICKYSLMFGLPLVWHLLSQTIQSQIDRIMIENFLGDADAGIYSFVYTIGTVLQVFFYSTDNVWSVWFFESIEKNKINDIRNAYKKYIILILTIASLMILLSPEIILIMGGESYSEGFKTLVPIIIGIFFLFLYTFPVGIEYYAKKTVFIAIITLFAAMVNIFLNVWLIPLYGYVAAAYTTLITYLIMFIGHWVISVIIFNKLKIDNPFEIWFFILTISLISCFGFLAIILENYLVIRILISICIIAFFFIFMFKDIKIYLKSFLSKLKKEEDVNEKNI